MQAPFTYRSSIALFAHKESFNIALPTPIKSAFPYAISLSALSGVVIPPVNITGILTAFLISSDCFEKYPCSLLL